jgi:hypothetical protein
MIATVPRAHAQTRTRECGAFARQSLRRRVDFFRTWSIDILMRRRHEKNNCNRCQTPMTLIHLSLYRAQIDRSLAREGEMRIMQQLIGSQKCSKPYPREQQNIRKSVLSSHDRSESRSQWWRWGDVTSSAVALSCSSEPVLVSVEMSTLRSIRVDRMAVCFAARDHFRALKHLR